MIDTPKRPLTTGSNGGMNIAPLGLWFVIPLIVPAVVAGFLGVLALRGTRPEQRPEILHALASLTAALLFRGGKSRAPAEAPAASDESLKLETDLTR